MNYILAPLIFLSLATGFAAQTTAQQATPPAPDTARSGADAVVDPDRGDADDRLERAVTRPLRDLNIMKPELAEALEAVMANPYNLAGLKTCRGLNNEVNRMTGLVGPDVDDPSLKTREGRDPVEFLMDGAEGITGSLVPGQGIIRELTGASRAARHVAAARLAGQLRRTYIKGNMKARGCQLRQVTPAAAGGAAKR